MKPFLWNKPLTVDSPGGQAALAQAHRQGERVECRCRTPYPLMYIASVGGRLYVKRMPDTGSEHAPDCSSFQAPGELSGLSQVQASAITESPEDGVTTLKVGFALKKQGKARMMPELSGKPATEAKETPRKLTLNSVLHYLWHEGDLGKWYPAMEGKRSWRTVHAQLRKAAAGKVMKGADLGQILYVPEPFHPDHKSEIAARRRRQFAALAPSRSGSQPLGLVVAEYVSHEPAKFGYRFRFKHAPDCSFFCDEDLAKRFERVFADKLQLAGFFEGAHAMVIGTFSVSKTGMPTLHEIGMMLVSRTWLPFEHLREGELVTHLVEQKRAFQKSLRFNLDLDAPIAFGLLLDMRDPVALFVSESPDNTDQVSALIETASESRFVDWLWVGHEAIPDLPEPGITRFAGQREGQGS